MHHRARSTTTKTEKLRNKKLVPSLFSNTVGVEIGFDLGTGKSRVPSGYQASVFSITSLVAPPRLKNMTLSFVIFVACSKRSDRGERCEVKKAMKSRGGLGTARHTVEENHDYQGLEKGKRAQSAFISNANSDYQIRSSRGGSRIF